MSNGTSPIVVGLPLRRRSSSVITFSLGAEGGGAAAAAAANFNFQQHVNNNKSSNPLHLTAGGGGAFGRTDSTNSAASSAKRFGGSDQSTSREPSPADSPFSGSMSPTHKKLIAHSQLTRLQQQQLMALKGDADVGVGVGGIHGAVYDDETEGLMLVDSGGRGSIHRVDRVYTSGTDPLGGADIDNGVSGNSPRGGSPHHRSSNASQNTHATLHDLATPQSASLSACVSPLSPYLRALGMGQGGGGSGDIGGQQSPSSKRFFSIEGTSEQVSRQLSLQRSDDDSQYASRTGSRGNRTAEGGNGSSRQLRTLSIQSSAVTTPGLKGLQPSEGGAHHHVPSSTSTGRKVNEGVVVATRGSPKGAATNHSKGSSATQAMEAMRLKMSIPVLRRHLVTEMKTHAKAIKAAKYAKHHGNTTSGGEIGGGTTAGASTGLSTETDPKLAEAAERRNARYNKPIGPLHDPTDATDPALVTQRCPEWMVGGALSDPTALPAMQRYLAIKDLQRRTKLLNDHGHRVGAGGGASRDASPTNTVGSPTNRSAGTASPFSGSPESPTGRGRHSMTVDALVMTKRKSFTSSGQVGGVGGGPNDGGADPFTGSFVAGAAGGFSSQLGLDHHTLAKMAKAAASGAGGLGGLTASQRQASRQWQSPFEASPLSSGSPARFLEESGGAAYVSSVAYHSPYVQRILAPLLKQTREREKLLESTGANQAGTTQGNTANASPPKGQSQQQRDDGGGPTGPHSERRRGSSPKENPLGMGHNKTRRTSTNSQQRGVDNSSFGSAMAALVSNPSQFMFDATVTSNSSPRGHTNNNTAGGATASSSNPLNNSSFHSTTTMKTFAESGSFVYPPTFIGDNNRTGSSSGVLVSGSGGRVVSAAKFRPGSNASIGAAGSSTTSNATATQQHVVVVPSSMGSTSQQQLNTNMLSMGASVATASISLSTANTMSSTTTRAILAMPHETISSMSLTYQYGANNNNNNNNNSSRNPFIHGSITTNANNPNSITTRDGAAAGNSMGSAHDLSTTATPNNAMARAKARVLMQQQQRLKAAQNSSNNAANGGKGGMRKGAVGAKSGANVLSQQDHLVAKVLLEEGERKKYALLHTRIADQQNLQPTHTSILDTSAGGGEPTNGAPAAEGESAKETKSTTNLPSTGATTGASIVPATTKTSSTALVIPIVDGEEMEQLSRPLLSKFRQKVTGAQLEQYEQLAKMEGDHPWLVEPLAGETTTPSKHQHPALTPLRTQARVIGGASPATALVPQQHTAQSRALEALRQPDNYKKRYDSTATATTAMLQLRMQDRTAAANAMGPTSSYLGTDPATGEVTVNPAQMLVCAKERTSRTVQQRELGLLLRVVEDEEDIARRQLVLAAAAEAKARAAALDEEFEQANRWRRPYKPKLRV